MNRKKPEKTPKITLTQGGLAMVEARIPAGRSIDAAELNADIAFGRAIFDAWLKPMSDDFWRLLESKPVSPLALQFLLLLVDRFSEARYLQQTFKLTGSSGGSKPKNPFRDRAMTLLAVELPKWRHTNGGPNLNRAFTEVIAQISKDIHADPQLLKGKAPTIPTMRRWYHEEREKYFEEKGLEMNSRPLQV